MSNVFVGSIYEHGPTGKHYKIIASAQLFEEDVTFIVFCPLDKKGFSINSQTQCLHLAEFIAFDEETEEPIFKMVK